MRIDRMAAMLMLILLVVAVATITGCPKPEDTETSEPYTVPVDVAPPADDGATEPTGEEPTDEATDATETGEEATDETAASGDWTTTDSGLKIQDVKVGDGAEAVAGKQVLVKYRGTLDDGSEFDAGEIPFPLGVGRVIPGWDEGIEGMKVGGKRNLEIPSDLGYGGMGSPPKIPGGATLHFECELLEVN